MNNDAEFRNELRRTKNTKERIILDALCTYFRLYVCNTSNIFYENPPLRIGLCCWHNELVRKSSANGATIEGATVKGLLEELLSAPTLVVGGCFAKKVDNVFFNMPLSEIAEKLNIKL